MFLIDKKITKDKAKSLLKPGSRVFVGSGSGTPGFISELTAQPIELIHLFKDGVVKGPSVSQHLMFQGENDLHDTKTVVLQQSFPCVETQLRTMSRPLDAVFVPISKPNANGVCSYGTHVGVLPAAFKAKLKIGVMNANIPTTHGDGIQLESFDFYVSCDSPLYKERTSETSYPSNEIARSLAELVQDGDTIQCGFDSVSAAFLPLLSAFTDQSLYSDVITEGAVSLVAKGHIRNVVHGSYARGSNLFEALEDEQFQFSSVGSLTSPYRLRRLTRLVACAPITQVDLTGQCSMMGKNTYACYPEFLHAASGSPKGKSIVYLPSMNGKHSNVTLSLKDTTASIPRTDVEFVVTEYGIAEVAGKSIPQKAKAIIQIAHPDARDSLLKDAYRIGLIPSGWKVPSTNRFEMKNLPLGCKEKREPFLIRPGKSSDYPAVQRLLHLCSSNSENRVKIFSAMTSLADNSPHFLNSLSSDFLAVAMKEGDLSSDVVGVACIFAHNAKSSFAEAIIEAHSSDKK
ncbi:MAG: acetyl-CoA hydrolase/transferase C-terminal domain-containing protein, partial [Kangiellaceae bacterium]|nr:acetyl-CoA hydrolase/transferase C-terminal domain-containing protein [Kangiellaceae bacterium]